MTDWNSIVRGSLIGLEPYRPGASLDELKETYGLDEIVKLNWNEGLEGPFPGVEEEVVAELERAWIYPAEAYSDLRESVAAWLGTSPERIVPSHGIQALIATVAHAFLDPGDSVVLTSPTYGLYATTCAGAGAEIVEVPSRDLRHDVDALAAAARETRQTGLALRPEQPDGRPGRARRVGAALGRAPRALRGASTRPTSNTSTRACASTGSRCGGGSADRGHANVFQDLRPRGPAPRLRDRRRAARGAPRRRPGAFNVNRAALAAGRASLRRTELVEGRRLANVQGRERLAERLREAGATPYPSQANFLLVDVGVDDLALTEGLARRGFLVRAGSEFGLAGFSGSRRDRPAYGTLRRNAR